MSDEGMDTISESDSLPTIPESDALILLPDSDRTSLVQDSGSNPAITANTMARVGHTRRYSTGDVDIPYARVKILSRYLAASGGSCHDTCKYETRQIRETKMRHPTLKRVAEIQGQESEKAETAGERKKKLAANFMPSPGSKGLKANIPFRHKKFISLSSEKDTISYKQLSLPSKAMDVSATCVIGPKLNPVRSKPSSFPIKGRTFSHDDRGTQEKKESEALPTKLHRVSSSSRKSVLKKSKTVSLSAIHSVKKALMRPLVSLSRKRSLKRVSSTNAEKFKQMEGVSYLKDRNSDDHAEPEQPGSEAVPEKTLHVIEMNTKDKTLKDDRNGIRTAPLAPPPVKKNLRCTQNSIKPAQQPRSSENKSSRSAKDGTRVRRSSLSSLVSLASSSKSTHGCNRENCEAEKANRILNAELESKARRRKGVANNSKDKDSQAKKLFFRTGKVVELKPEISTRRRLEYGRRARSDTQISNVDTGIADLRSTEVDDGKISVTGNESEKVVLRHQDVEGKKTVQPLLNDMIEETASKLAQTRKSKVEVLVGAFETVISSQDSKPSSAVDTS